MSDSFTTSRPGNWDRPQKKEGQLVPCPDCGRLRYPFSGPHSPRWKTVDGRHVQVDCVGRELPADPSPDAGLPAGAPVVERRLAEAEDGDVGPRAPAHLPAHEADDLAPEATGTSRQFGVAGAGGEQVDPVEP